jgi:hypothetical protein
VTASEARKITEQTLAPEQSKPFLEKIKAAATKGENSTLFTKGVTEAIRVYLVKLGYAVTEEWDDENRGPHDHSYHKGYRVVW